MLRPAAIVLINDNISAEILNHLVHQLQINEVLDGYEFDLRLAADPNYVAELKSLDYRMLVKRNLAELTNREQFDIVLSVKYGLAAIEVNKFGPHGFTLQIINITWPKILYRPVPAVQCRKTHHVKRCGCSK